MAGFVPILQNNPAFLECTSRG